MGLALYNLLLPFYLVAALPGLLVKMRRRGGYGAHFWQRFGCYDKVLRLSLASGRRSWWLHGVSVGEVLIAVKLIERIVERFPEQPVILSTTSSTGYATARDKAPPGVRVIYNPVDLPGIVQRALRRLRPGIIVLMESELWPNLIASAARRGIPVVIANARLSTRSGRRYARFRYLISPTLNRLTAVLTQEESDAARWCEAGLVPEKIHPLGSIKFDPAAHRAPDEAQLGALRALREGLWGAGEIYTIVLGSSHAGEELAMSKVYLELRREFPQVRLILVPRHFERASEILTELDALGLPVEQRSRWPERRARGEQGEPPVLLVDTTGELRTWYALADAVVMGKSFLAQGGQNPVEPIMAGCPVVAGPHMENFAALVALLNRVKGFCQVSDFKALEVLLATWIREPPLAVAVATAGRRALETHAGATERAIEKLLAIAHESA